MLTLTQQRFVYLLAATIWGAFIFYLSSIPDLASGLPTIQDLILRKAAHIFVFATLVYLLAKSLNSTQRHYLLFVIIAGITYALIDEIHQLGVPGRAGQATDILIDTLGVFIGTAVFIQRQKGLFE